MYRQTVGLKKVAVHVIAKKWVDPDRSPAVGFDVEVIPVPTALPKGRLARYAIFMKNWRHQFFLGTSAELDWWRERIKRNPPDVILCHFGTTAARLLPLLKDSGIPVVAHFNGNDLSGQIRKASYRWRLLKNLDRLSGCVVVADYMTDWLLKHGYPESRIRLIPYGTPLHELSEAIDVGRQPCRFLAVGRFTEKKRPDLTIRAFARCVESCPEVELRMVGNGELLDSCQRLVEELGIQEKVCFVGVLPSDQVKKELAEACVFVQHSVEDSEGDKEGWPVAVAEAAGTGLPVVSTIHAGIPTQVDHGHTGFLVEEGDWQSMAQHMIELAKSPNLRLAMGQAAREKMASFDTRDQVAKLDDFLCELALEYRTK